MMIGGDMDAVKHLDPIFATLAPGIGTIERTPGGKAATLVRSKGISMLGRSAPDTSSK